MSPARKQKKELITELISEFRTAGNQDSAFDNLAAEHLGLNRTDLHCINIIENSGGLTAGELAAPPRRGSGRARPAPRPARCRGWSTPRGARGPPAAQLTRPTGAA